MTIVATVKKNQLYIAIFFSLSFYHFSFYGNLFLIEVLLFIVFIHALLSKNFNFISEEIPLTSSKSALFRNNVIKYLFALAIVSFISGIYRDINFLDQIKGIALVLFTLTNYLGLRYLTKFRMNFITASFLGFGISGILGFIFQPTVYAKTQIWKFGLSYSITYIVILLLVSKIHFKKKFYRYLLIAYGALAIFLGTRSLGLCIITTGCLLLFKSKYPQMQSFASRKLNWVKVVGFFTLIATLVLATGVFYGFAAKAGYLGEKAKKQYLMQSSGDLGPIVGGRSEPIIGLFAVLQSPIFGYGYGADSADKMYEKANRFFQNQKYDVNIQLIRSDNQNQIPQHSYILNFWISYGILGLLFWIFILNSLWKIVVLEILAPTEFLPLILYVSILSCWNIFFSPYGASVRIEFAIILTLIETVLLRSKTATI